ncbi:COP9 signalosome [Trametes meyenii]|nr:COP9 signalosome [Trametes meyenii]
MAPPQLVQLYKEIQQTFMSGNLQQTGVLLTKLKIALTEAGLLVPLGTPSPQDLVIARDILEVGAFWSIRTKDIPSFDRYFSQLQTFYNDYRLNRIADFHTTLESLPLPADALTSNPYIAHPINLEQWLMEGSYSKVWNAREEAPAEEYKFFVDSLMGTIRNEIASCEETAYDSLPLKDAATLLFFKNQSELLTFAQQRGWQVDLTAGKITFAKKTEEKVEIPKEKLILANLQYARELEQIV